MAHSKYRSRKWYKGRKRFGRLKRYRRRHRRHGRSIARLPIGGYPKSMMMRLRYVTSITVDAGGGALADHLFRCNGLYDPNYTGVGHQPLGFDQAMAIYDHYTVVGARIKCSVMNTTPSETVASQVPGAWGLMITDDDQGINSRYTSTMNLLENIEGKGMVRYTQAGPGTASQKRPILSRNFSAKKFFGVSKIVGDDLYRGTNSADPQEEAFFRVWVGSIGSNNPYNARFLVEIEYLAVFTERKLIPAS